MRVELKGKLDILSITATDRDIELDYESDIDEFGPNRRKSF